MLVLDANHHTMLPISYKSCMRTIAPKKHKIGKIRANVENRLKMWKIGNDVENRTHGT